MQANARMRLRGVGLELCWPAPPSESDGAGTRNPDSPVNKMGQAENHKLITQWLNASRAKDFPTAIRLRHQLRLAGVDIDPVESYLRPGEVARPYVRGDRVGEAKDKRSAWVQQNLVA